MNLELSHIISMALAGFAVLNSFLKRNNTDHTKIAILESRLDGQDKRLIEVLNELKEMRKEQHDFYLRQRPYAGNGERS